MFKKLLIASAILVMGTSMSFAGRHHYKGEVDYKGEKPMVCPTYQYTAGPYLGLSVGSTTSYTHTPTVYQGFQGTLSAGWAGMLDPMWYLAGEVYVGDSAQINDYKAIGGNGVRTSWTYGLDLIPGVMITDYVLLYLRAGVVTTRFSDISTYKTGWQAGIGAQTNIYENWDGRIEYIYSGYGSIDSIGKPTVNQANIGVIYKFV